MTAVLCVLAFVAGGCVATWAWLFALLLQADAARRAEGK